MSEEKTEKQTTENDSSIYYVLGGVVLVAAIAGFFLLRPKENIMTSPEAPAVTTQEAPVPTPGPITKLDCGKMYYNPVVGFPKYFLSLEGVDVLTQGDINCTFTISVKDKTVATTEVTAPLTEQPSRGGATFRCSTDAIELAKGIATDVEVKAVNPEGQETTCKQTFVFP